MLSKAGGQHITTHNNLHERQGQLANLRQSESRRVRNLYVIAPYVANSRIASDMTHIGSGTNTNTNKTNTALLPPGNQLPAFAC
eukprot:scaffold185324_cov20-Prasinocladus_malaysianus.AAC.1